MRAILQDQGELLGGIGGAESVRLRTHLLEGQASLVDGARRAMRDVFADDREGLPEGIGLESQDDLHASTLGYLLDEAEVTP